ncbi:UspA domain-containing protein [Pseudodesulfovibrio mercurii]|uniref:UspA domain-containing protein n=1 Tax=Pseudodesulfovibrio mercurii TaxID=641491 RepID=F0JDS5_9BACT|nr:universal stress protein [Pseudodesulfovibrio mercurii]EGB14607.1 UspA domain-containing protein [Pseudodesulfovibrio mercurii]
MDFKKVLIAVDGSENSLRAVRYAAAILDGGRGYDVLLVHIERLPERDMFPDETSWSGQCREHSQAMRDFLDRAAAELEAGGLSAGEVCSQYIDSCAARPEGAEDCSHGRNIALEILSIAEEGGYGTLVIGRRGVSKAEEFLFGSVSNKLIHHAKDRTVWVVS